MAVPAIAGVLAAVALALPQTLPAGLTAVAATPAGPDSLPPVRASEPGVLFIRSGPQPSLAGSDRGVFFVGDSLTFETWGWGGLARRARAAGLAVSGIEAQGGLEVSEVAARLAPMVARLPGIVVIAVGSNDLIRGTTAADFRRAAERVVSLLKGRVVLWVNVSGHPDALMARREQAINSSLQAVDRRYRHVHVADWSGYLRARPELVAPHDPFQVHLTGAGTIARAQFYVDAVTPYAPRPVGSASGGQAEAGRHLEPLDLP